MHCWINRSLISYKGCQKALKNISGLLRKGVMRRGKATTSRNLHLETLIFMYEAEAFPVKYGRELCAHRRHEDVAC